jgi:hypothetical protein
VFNAFTEKFGASAKMARMGHVTSQQAWATLDIDTENGVVLVREDWHYTWHADPGVQPFTLFQKRAFHRRLDREIWGKWSWHFHLHVHGDTPFAHRFKDRTVTVNFDIRWLPHRGQWEVEVIRVPPTMTMSNRTRSNVTFATRHIQLFSLLFTPYTAQTSSGVSRPGFRAGPHEFGHTLDYPDDYTPQSPYLGDIDSIMNIGQQLRNRHIALVITTLNTMIPGVTFEL